MKHQLYKQNTAYPVTNLENDEPEIYQIVIHNDDFTTMEFVMEILEKFFFKERREAAEIMLEAHQHGRASCGHFSKDVAETKIEQIVELARNKDYPLVCSMEAA